MRNTVCIICSKEFEPREGKLYCSNACKQKGYTDSKHQIAVKQIKEQEQKTEKEKFVFYYSDYQEYKKQYPKSLDSFLLFSFFRKNIKTKFDVEQFRSYINSFDNDWWNAFYGINDWGEHTDIISPARKKYNEFQEKYFGDESIIYFEQSGSE